MGDTALILGLPYTYMYAISGHVFLQSIREQFVGFVVPAVYVVGIDTWAISMGIWGVEPKYASRIYILGMRIDHVMIYSLTTLLVSISIAGMLRSAEIYAVRRSKNESAFKTWLNAFLWG